MTQQDFSCKSTFKLRLNFSVYQIKYFKLLFHSMLGSIAVILSHLDQKILEHISEKHHYNKLRDAFHVFMFLLLRQNTKLCKKLINMKSLDVLSVSVDIIVLASVNTCCFLLRSVGAAEDLGHGGRAELAGHLR